MLREEREAEVLIAVIPQPTEEKLGVDDHLAHRGVNGVDGVDNFGTSLEEKVLTAQG